MFKQIARFVYLIFWRGLARDRQAQHQQDQGESGQQRVPQRSEWRQPAQQPAQQPEQRQATPQVVWQPAPQAVRQPARRQPAPQAVRQPAPQAVRQPERRQPAPQPMISKRQLKSASEYTGLQVRDGALYLQPPAGVNVLSMAEHFDWRLDSEANYCTWESRAENRKVAQAILSYAIEKRMHLHFFPNGFQVTSAFIGLLISLLRDFTSFRRDYKFKPEFHVSASFFSAGIGLDIDHDLRVQAKEQGVLVVHQLPVPVADEGITDRYYSILAKLAEGSRLSALQINGEEWMMQPPEGKVVVELADFVAQASKKIRQKYDRELDIELLSLAAAILKMAEGKNIRLSAEVNKLGVAVDRVIIAVARQMKEGQQFILSSYDQRQLFFLNGNLESELYKSGKLVIPQPVIAFSDLGEDKKREIRKNNFNSDEDSIFQLVEGALLIKLPKGRYKLRASDFGDDWSCLDRMVGFGFDYDSDQSLTYEKGCRELAALIVEKAESKGVSSIQLDAGITHVTDPVAVIFNQIYTSRRNQSLQIIIQGRMPDNFDPKIGRTIEHAVENNRLLILNQDPVTGALASNVRDSPLQSTMSGGGGGRRSFSIG